MVWTRTRATLNTLKSELSRTKVLPSSDQTLLDSLDPEGIHFEPFRRAIEKLAAGLDGQTNTLSHRWASDIGTAARATHWAQELQAALHFSFIDYVLQQDEDASFPPSLRLDMRYPTEWYSGARQMQRDIHLHIGPTNSGKTYNALKRLEETGDGFYAGPLRLLAHEVYSRFKAKGVPCDLVTGDDVRLAPDGDVRLKSSTVEMVDVSTPVEVAVIDEIQMMASQDRGWAWTRAFLGANAKEVHLCGEARILPLVRELTASTGDTLHIHEYQRLNPLKVMTRSLQGDLKNLRKGDCVVAFSVMDIHALKKEIELDTGRRCAIVYGSLPPETRSQQAALFNDPNNDYDYLVASDAIGMGLNLSVKRIIFQTVWKWNGYYSEQLTIPQIKQIGGRAGRYRPAQAHGTDTGTATATADSDGAIGLVTTLDERDLPVVRDAMLADDPPINVAGLLPPGDFLEDRAQRVPPGTPHEYLLRRLCETASLHRRFQVCRIRDQTFIARAIEPVRGLTTTQRVTLTAAPAYGAGLEISSVLRALAQCIADRRQITVVDLPEIRLEILEKPISGDREYLRGLEDLHKTLILYLWLSYRFIANFKDRDMAMHAKDMVEERINTCLLEFSANPRLRKRVLSNKKMVLPRLGSLPRPDPDLADAPEAALPVDWTWGSSEVELRDDTMASQPSQTLAG